MKGKRLFGATLAMALVPALLAGLSLGAGRAPARAQENGGNAGGVLASPLGTAFTYQGQLVKDGIPLSGTCSLRFRLWDGPQGGWQVGPTLTRTGVVLSGGLFTVNDLDFGAQFSGDARWLEVAVMCGDDPDYTTLTPRQALTAAPAALSLTLPFTAQGSSGDALVSVNNSGAGDALRVESAGGDGVHVYQAADYGVRVGGAGLQGVRVDDADLVGVHVSSAGDNGVSVGSANNSGLYVVSAGSHGVHVFSAGVDGVRVVSAGDDGVHVNRAGDPSTTTLSDLQNGFEVAGAQGDGLYVGRADADGLRVESAGKFGVEVASASYGVYVGSTTYDGLRVISAGDHGLRVDDAADDGVYVFQAGDIGAYANTTQANHEWGFYTPDKIYAGSALASGGPSLIVAQAAEALEPGDSVAVAGLGAPFASSDFPTPLVCRVAPGTALAGVVYARFVAEEEVEEVERDGQVETRGSLIARSADGPVAPGDHLLLVVLGPARVRAAGPVAPGELLGVTPGGQAARLAGAYVPGALLGTALEGLDQDGLIWVLVNPR